VGLPASRPASSPQLAGFFVCQGLALLDVQHGTDSTGSLGRTPMLAPKSAMIIKKSLCV
jgi:hypothetical protein